MKTIISYLGPACTFSERAARRLAERDGTDAELAPLTSIQAVARSVSPTPEQRAIDYAVLPYYNYLEGLVQESLDLIYEHRLTIIDAQRVAIDWAIGRYPGDRSTDCVYSHPKALAQCSEYLWQNVPHASLRDVASTAEAGRIVQSEKSGLAIASAEALRRFDLEIIAEDIGNRRHGKLNFTDFYLLSPSDHRESYDPSASYFTMIAVTPYMDRPGLLAEVLHQVAYYELNNAKIHSRPAIDNVTVDVDPQMFYLEMMCHKTSEPFVRCVDSLRYRLTPAGASADVVRVLGSYKRPTLS